jgi:hypothetical protein
MPFQALVRGRSATGQAFEARTSLKNLSASGLFMMLEQRLSPGDRLFVVVTLTTENRQAARIAIRAAVQRTETCANDLQGVALKFTSYRYL